VLAAGLGAGVVQSAAQDPVACDPAEAGTAALGTQQSQVVAATGTQPSSTSGTPISRAECETDDPAPQAATTEAPAAEVTPPAAEPAAAAEPAPTAATSTPAAASAPPAPATTTSTAPAPAPAAATPAATAPQPAGEAKPGDEAHADDHEREPETGEDEHDEDEHDDEREGEHYRPDAERRRRERREREGGDDGHGHGDEHALPADVGPRRPTRNAGGVPTFANPTTSLAVPGPARVGMPNFFIDRFRIPPFLLPIYQAAGTEYGVRWEILAAINEIETDYGRNLAVSSAGALGWMQFMPATWRAYGVDANGDGRKDPWNPVDAIFAAARYLEASGAEDDLRRAIFAYNHADWYVDSVLMRARLIGGLPTDLVGSLTGLTQGRFPVAARTRYADDGFDAPSGAAERPRRDGVRLYAAAGSRVVATHDGRVVARGRSERLGRYVRVRDAYGNTYTYGNLGELETSHPVPRRGARARRAPLAPPRAAEPAAGRVTDEGAPGKERLFAHPERPASYRAGGGEQMTHAGASAPAPAGDAAYVDELLNLRPDQVTWQRLRPGSHVVAGTVLGRIGQSSSTRSSNTLFEIRPAGRGAPRIDPKPILDGWKLLESTAIYRAEGRNPFFGRDARTPSIGQILLMSKEQLGRRVLANPRVDVYGCGRRDIRAGIIDRRVLATLEFLAANGLRPTVSSLRCGHGYYTASGNVSHHTTGTAVDIAAINGVPILGHQGRGSVTDVTIRRLLTLQGPMRPAQIISLMTYEGANNTIAMGDHADHIHIGWQPGGATGGSARGGGARPGGEPVLRPSQWYRVVDRLNRIENPRVRVTPRRRARP